MVILLLYSLVDNEKKLGLPEILMTMQMRRCNLERIT